MIMSENKIEQIKQTAQKFVEDLKKQNVTVKSWSVQVGKEGEGTNLKIIFAITAIVIIFMTCFALVGPSILGGLNIDTANVDQVLNSAPKFPVLQNLNWC